jgi:SAM-dependent methyltransferase
MDSAEPFRLLNLQPCLKDWTSTTPVDRYYFYQDTWAAEKIIKNAPEFHLDIGSTVLLVGMLSKITRVCSVDIRPLPVILKNMEFRKGSILELPFENGQIHSLSSLCVIEHIGLGRYGDSLDPLGVHKAVKELSRVIGKGGNLYVSVPIGEHAVYFNAFIMFDLEEFITMFKGFKLLDTQFILNDRVCTMEEYMKLDKSSYVHRMVIGCFHFQKEI